MTLEFFDALLASCSQNDGIAWFLLEGRANELAVLLVVIHD